MAFSVNTNITSLQAQEYLRVTSDFQGKTINRVTSGLRIVSSGDDAAGLAIANSFRSDQAVLSQGVRNANDGLSTLQTIDGGMSNISKLLDRARTLATQSASGTFTGDRSVLNNEFQSVMSEINRQAQAVGLNNGGAFNASLSVFVGGGRKSGSDSAIDNGSVSVDLSKSNIDTQGLGLEGFKATGNSTANISNVTEIIASGANQATQTKAGYTDFYFVGEGFASEDYNKIIKVSVDVSQVKNTDDLATAINNAITTVASGASTEAVAFKNADISAGIVTGTDGKQQLAFTSSSAAFQVRAGDSVASALMGNFDSSTTAGAVAGSYVVGAAPGAGADGVLTVSSSALSGNKTITLTAAAQSDLTETLDQLNTQFAADDELNALGFQAYNDGGAVAIRSGAGIQFAVTPTAAGDGGFAAAVTSSVDQNGVILAGGASTIGSENVLTFSGTALSGTDSQTITVSAKDDTGTVHSKVITLNSSSTTISSAVEKINSDLAGSDDATLSKIVAMTTGDDSSNAAITFASSLNNFTVSLGAGTSNHGFVSDSAGAKDLTASVVGSGGQGDISTDKGAQSAVSALADAVQKLGDAQAVVGKGQNRFNYAINLAQSQLSNLAAAESRIRDADLANEAANLTKAQILVQAGVAALAQANSAPQQILSLLRG